MMCQRVPWGFPRHGLCAGSLSEGGIPGDERGRGRQGRETATRGRIPQVTSVCSDRVNPPPFLADSLVCKVFTVGVLPEVEGRIVPGAQNPRTWPSGREGNASEGWACA